MKNSATYSTNIWLVLFMLLSFSVIAQHKLLLDSLQKGLTSGKNVDVSLRAYNFNGILGIQGSIVWDSSVLQYNGIIYGTNTNIKLDNNLVNSYGNYLTFIWSDPSLNPQTIPDSTILLTLNFTVLNNSYTTNAVSLSNIPTSVQIIDSISITPVKIKKFTADYINGAVNLNWIATEEINSLFFDIECSENGKNFKRTDRVLASNSALGGSYHYSDKAPGGSKLYYRLKMVDKQGTYSYSNTVVVDIRDNCKFSIYPNPATENISIEMLIDKPETVIAEIINLQGKVVLTKGGIKLNPGINNIPLNVSSLNKGEYVVIIKGKDILEKEFIKY